ncbi:MAG: hypothetical protein IIY62_00605, partial [Kiritimatiellae bacterium]|nr:hypothetical protein [Kiritimatiellia bacterium]
IEEMDGTLLGSTKGFTLKAEVMNETESLEPGTPWKDYFKPYTKKIYVDNVAPETSNVTEPGTNAWVVAGGLATSRPIKFAVKNDVTADLDGIPAFPGIKVTITGCESGELTPAIAAHTNPMEFYIGPDEPRAYTFTPNFGSVQGDQTITLTITDKDQGEQTWTYLYTITPSKFLHTLANGPSGGTTTSQLSQKYALADGIGMGHTFVDGAIFAGAKNFRLSWNCSKQIYMNIYGFGYKVANPNDDGTLDGMDQAIDQTGSAPFTGANFHYPAADLEGEDLKDSYFYCWLLHAQGEQGGMTSSILGNTIAPERPGVIGQGTVTLPTEQTQDGSYVDTLVEAIFAKEWLPADNLGDINQDGVPDAFAIKTWKGGKLIPLVAGVENDADADLVNLADSNPDEDYLPGVFQQDGMVALVDSARNSYAPVGIPLTTRTEIRGFDRGLNAIDITRSDAEFSEDEQKAYTAATGNAYDPATVDLAVWSPEPRSSKYARMDPTLADTDADGFPDGWEYYFWYQAHVWVPADADGPGKPRNGQSFVFERFNVADILNGTQIPAAEVEARFNPCDPVDPEAYAKKPDFDNDGLSDLEELAIGTNPCHWDTDGDRMCDGWEVMMCLDPLGDSRSSNPDGDFMAFHQIGADYVYLDPAGDADPYAQGAVLYIITSPLTAGGDIDLAPPNAVALHDLHVKAVRFTPKYEGGENLVYGRLEDLPEEIQPDTAWGMYMVEGLERVEIDIPEGTTLLGGLTYVLVHDQVHQAFGFDPRTGWFRTGSGYVANRWDPMVNGDLRLSDVTGLAVNTRPYMTYDEYLVMRYRLQYGKVYPDEKGGFDNDKPWETLVAKTTNPNVASPKIVTTDDDAAGDGETTTGDGETTTGDGETETEETPASLIAKALAEAFAQAGSTRAPITTHGADTDGDGVPDGWELYMNRNPNAGPGEMEDGRGLPDKRDYDGDQLAYALEYAGTDSCNAYEGCDSIYKNHPGNASGWFNKFFPTNPGANRGPDMGDGADTDGDGILDILEGMTWRAPFFYEGQTIVPCEMGFIYGTPADDASCCIRGGGMNPCTVDTDQDGLPDGWEMQHAGVPVDLATRKPVPPVGGQVTIDLELSTATIIADGLAEAATEGVYIMGGMDATWGSDAITRDSVKDPVVGTIRDTDFDHDGLQNFQEYAVQSLRHFRYDDNVTPLMGRLFTAGAPHCPSPIFRRRSATSARRNTLRSSCAAS